MTLKRQKKQIRFNVFVNQLYFVFINKLLSWFVGYIPNEILVQFSLCTRYWREYMTLFPVLFYNFAGS